MKVNLSFNAKAPDSIPKVKLTFYGQNGKIDRWKGYLYTLIYNYSVNNGIKMMFRYANGVGWLLQDYDQLDHRYNNVASIACGGQEAELYKLADLDLSMLWVRGLCTTHAPGQNPIFHQSLFLPEADQRRCLDIVWRSKITWLQLEYRAGEAYRQASLSMAKLAAGMNRLGITMIDTREAFITLSKILEDTFINLDEAVDGES